MNNINAVVLVIIVGNVLTIISLLVSQTFEFFSYILLFKVLVYKQLIHSNAMMVDR